MGRRTLSSENLFSIISVIYAHSKAKAFNPSSPKGRLKQKGHAAHSLTRGLPSNSYNAKMRFPPVETDFWK